VKATTKKPTKPVEEKPQEESDDSEEEQPATEETPQSSVENTNGSELLDPEEQMRINLEKMKKKLAGSGSKKKNSPLKTSGGTSQTKYSTTAL
jgi:hypothetical protein